jgi:alkanesulfonate monooxygenase SsuD/methylene tetrahydromethanopterin reductase-like flavin-dependent oxidoreductase (luciferase family)
MEFGYFAQIFVPRFELDTDPAAEHKRLLMNLELAVEVEQHGVKYVWGPEHHFLEEYSHAPAPEVFLSFVAARTTRLHVGSAIFNTTPPVNHPVRVAERVAVLDHLSEGRFEFGTGRGSSSTEYKGFGIPDGPTTRAMWDETIGQFVKMWRDAQYEHEGRWFATPPRAVLPKPYTRPHPPMWVACGSPDTFEKAGRLGLGAFCFTGGSPRDLEPLVATYKAAIERAEPVGDYVNDNILCVSNLLCMEDRDEAFRLGSTINMAYYQALAFRWLDTFPKPPNLPVWPDRLPEPTPEQLAAQVAQGIVCVGDPDDCRRVCQMYDDIGVDQLAFAPLVTTMTYEQAVSSFALFGREVLPGLDTDPVHRTVRMREAASRS